MAEVRPATCMDEGLDDVVELAVEHGLALCAELQEVVVGALSDAAGAANDAAAEHGARNGGNVLAAYQQLLNAARAEALGRFRRQEDRLKTFNIVLFGRTGAGKSSLIEALSGGHGHPISQGESDWTVDVRDVRWASCRLYDTPGIGGWGRTVDRSELERRAEAAVSDADVVVLCFDTQSQQEGEFSKVAEWVTTYGKPAVAVLNSRNGRWRFPARVKSEKARRQLSRSVHEHAGNIRDELARVRMPDVPVVALHTKRATFARTADPYEGPDVKSREKLRTDYGVDQLLAWSNLPALQLLLSEAVREHASDLRLGMLHEQARGVLASALQQLRDEHRAVAESGAEQLERGIEDVLRILGRPEDRAFERRLAYLEELRDGGFDVAGEGEGERHARMRLAAKLRKPRQNAARRAERLVDKAFAERRDVDDAEFTRTVIEPALKDVEDVVGAVEAEVRSFLDQRLAMVADDVQADLQAALASFEGASGSAGRDARRLGIGLEVASATTSIGTGVVLGIAFANSWNPIGWALGGAVGVSAVAGWFGRRKRKQATQKREAARGTARAAARRAVNDTFTGLEADLATQFAEVFSKAATSRLGEEVERAVALRLLVASADRGEAALEAALAAVPQQRSSAHLLSEVARDVQLRSFPGNAAADRLLWLGESWCTDPVGLEVADADAEPERATSYDQRRRESLNRRLRAFFRRSSRHPAPGEGRAWLNESSVVLADDEAAVAAPGDVRALLGAGRPRLVVAGDYNAGKSSFVKRLLLDADVAPPDGLSIAARPETDAASTYAWEAWDVVDTPGFQSSDPLHGARAQAAIDTASLVLVLFNPNLVVGDPRHLRVLLEGDDVRTAKTARTVFVINRADELGVDPHDDLDAYEALCGRKELELRQALGSLCRSGGVDVQDDQVLCVASDPYGMVGNRRDATSADYDAHRDWDGLDAFHREVRAMTADREANGLDVAVLDGGAAALAALVVARRRRLADLDQRAGQERRLQLDLDACLSVGIAMRDTEQDRLASELVDAVAELYDEAMATADGMTKTERIAKLERWDEAPEVQQRFEQWQARADRDLEAWQRATSERIERRLKSAAFRQAFPDIGDAVDTTYLRAEEPANQGGAHARRAGKATAKVVENVGRDTVVRVAHRFGHKFQPWGAIKLTNKVNVAGAALGVVVGAWELRGIVKGVRQETADEETVRGLRADTLRAVREAAEVWFVAPGGAGGQLEASLEVVREVRRSVEATVTQLEAERQMLASQVDLCEERIAEARRMS